MARVPASDRARNQTAKALRGDFDSTAAAWSRQRVFSFDGQVVEEERRDSHHHRPAVEEDRVPERQPQARQHEGGRGQRADDDNAKRGMPITAGFEHDPSSREDQAAFC